MDTDGRDVEEIELGTVSQAERDKKPWKYIGYKGFARYAASTDEFLSLRRYDRLHCRALLTLQDNIAQLEEQLDSVDLATSRKKPDIDSGTIREDKVEERKILVDRICVALKKYDELLNNYISLKARPRATPKAVNNIKTWLSNTNQPIQPREIRFLDQDDLITTGAASKSLIRDLFERFILVRVGKLITWSFLRSNYRVDEDDPCTIYGKDEPVDRFASLAVFVAAFIMLIAPLWILAALEEINTKLGVITAFITILLCFMTSATSAKPFETLAVTAGYSAVLVVFLQMGSDTQTSASS